MANEYRYSLLYEPSIALGVVSMADSISNMNSAGDGLVHSTSGRKRARAQQDFQPDSCILYPLMLSVCYNFTSPSTGSVYLFISLKRGQISEYSYCSFQVAM